MTAPGEWFPFPLGPDEYPPEPSPGPLPVFSVYGDSFTTGYAGYGIGECNWSTRVARRLGVDVANMAVGGTGYVQCPGRSTFPFEATLHPVFGVDVQVVFGGFNDRMTENSPSVGVAAAVTFAALQRANPLAALVVAGPQWPNSYAPDYMKAHRDEIRAAAADAGAAWVDPLADRWFMDDPTLIWAGDGIHPTDAGHAFIADRIAPHVAAALSVRI